MRKKQQSDDKFLKIVEKCKSHGGPITANDVEKLEVLSYEEVRLEVKFLKKTTAPQLRLKRKVEKKFIDYTKDQLIQQMRDVLTPRNDPSSSLGCLLASALQLPSDVDNTTENADIMDTCSNEIPGDESIPIGAHSFWRGTDDIVELGVVVDDKTIQMFKKTRTGYTPFGLPEDVLKWELVEVIPEEHYHYIQKNHGYYLVLI